MDQFNKLRELATKLGLGETMRAIDDYAKQNELTSMAEIIDHMEAEVAEKESREEAAEHMIARSDDGNYYVSVDGGKTWEECSLEEYEELLAGGYKEVDYDLQEGLLDRLVKNIVPVNINEEESADNRWNESCNTRKELKEWIEKFKNNNKPYIVSRSTKEGYRWDIKEALDEAKEEVEIVKYPVEEYIKLIGANDGDYDFEEGKAKFIYTDKNEESAQVGIELENGLFAVVGLNDDHLCDSYDDMVKCIKAYMNECINEAKEEAVDAPVGEIIKNAEIELPLEKIDIISKINNTAKAICETIKNRYNIEVAPVAVVADVLQDLEIIDDDIDISTLEDSEIYNLTADMFDEYKAGYILINSVLYELTGITFEELNGEILEKANELLDSDEFKVENVENAIASEDFIKAVKDGDIKYLSAADLDDNETSDDVLDDDQGEEVEEETEVEEAEEVECKDCDESVEVDVDLFDKELNEYFNENYAETIVYITESGSINDEGQIILEGILKNETSEKNVTFTLTPIQPLTEALETQEDVIKALGCTEFKVENNLSEEVFKFNFKNDTNNVEIFEIKEKEKVDILNNFVKECKDCQKYMTPKEIVAQAAA